MELGCEGWLGVHTAGEMGRKVSQAEGTDARKNQANLGMMRLLVWLGHWSRKWEVTLGQSQIYKVSSAILETRT